MKPLILPYKGKYPKIDPTARIAPNAVITGDVEIGPHCSIWFNTVIRGDVKKIIIEEYCNLQDGVIIHSTRDRNDTHLGPHTSVGHGAILHGCRTEGYCLIGMGAVVLDDAVIEREVIVGAQALIAQNTVCKSGSIYGGIPAKKIKDLDREQAFFYISETSKAYVIYSGNYEAFTDWKR